MTSPPDLAAANVTRRSQPASHGSANSASRCFSAASVALAAFVGAGCTPMPRTLSPDEAPVVLLVSAERHEETAAYVAESTKLGFARLALDTGFATLDVWSADAERARLKPSGDVKSHEHRRGVTWLAGDAVWTPEGFSVYFDGHEARCRRFDDDGRVGDEFGCPYMPDLAMRCERSAVLVEEPESVEPPYASAAVALACRFDTDVPDFVSGLMKDGALWFPLRPGVLLSRFETDTRSISRFEPVPPGFRLIEAR